MAYTTWVWLDCDKHNQLRDLVVSWGDGGDQEEYIKCGCRYKAENEDVELSRLRMYEARRDSERMAQWAAALAPKPPESLEIPWWVPMLIVLLASVFFAVLSRLH